MFTISWFVVRLSYPKFGKTEGIHTFDTYLSLVLSLYYAAFITYWHSLDEKYSNEKMKYKYSYQIWTHLLTKTELWHLKEHTQTSRMLFYIFVINTSILLLFIDMLFSDKAKNTDTDEVLVFGFFSFVLLFFC